MCLLVIMCALALIRTVCGAVVTSGDNTVNSDNSNLGDFCFHECVPRCQQLVKTRDSRCCNCISLCEMACDTSYKTLSYRRLQESNALSPHGAPCACNLPDMAGRRPVAPRRSKRRPSRSPMLREAAIIARSVGLDLGPLDAGSDKNDVVDSQGGTQVVPRLVSLVPGEDAVTAVVSWDPLVTPGLPSGTPWYLVTFEPEGGGVRGNLLANSTSASLTLWRDTVYHIQVSSASSTAASSCLVVDTHPSSTPPLLARGATRGFALPRVEDLSGVAAAVVLFLVILVSAVRWRNRLEPSSKIIDQSHHDCDRLKLYPPPVTLRSLVEERRTTQQPPV